MSIFKEEKTPEPEIQQEEKSRPDRRRKECKDIASYSTNKKVREKIDRLLEKRAKLWANYEHILDNYPKEMRKRQEKENMRILEDMGAIKERIRQIDPVFAREISLDDNK